MRTAAPILAPTGFSMCSTGAGYQSLMDDKKKREREMEGEKLVLPVKVVTQLMGHRRLVNLL